MSTGLVAVSRSLSYIQCHVFFPDDLSQIALSMTSAMRQRYLRKYMRMTLFRFPLDLLQLRDPYRILNVTFFFFADYLSQIALSVTSLREKKREQREKDRREDSKRRENSNNKREKERACV